MTAYFCRVVINAGQQDKKEMAEMLDIFLLNHRITQDEYKELAELNNK